MSRSIHYPEVSLANGFLLCAPQYAGIDDVTDEGAPPVRTLAFPAGKLLAFAALSLADLILTWTLLQLNGGAIHEGNPIANAWLAQHGWVGLAMFKLMTLLLFMCACLGVFHYQPGKAGYVLNFGCIVLGAVVLYSLFLLRAYT